MAAATRVLLDRLRDAEAAAQLAQRAGSADASLAVARYCERAGKPQLGVEQYCLAGDRAAAFALAKRAGCVPQLAAWARQARDGGAALMAAEFFEAQGQLAAAAELCAVAGKHERAVRLHLQASGVGQRGWRRPSLGAPCEGQWRGEGDSASWHACKITCVFCFKIRPAGGQRRAGSRHPAGRRLQGPRRRGGRAGAPPGKRSFGALLGAASGGGCMWGQRQAASRVGNHCLPPTPLLPAGRGCAGRRPARPAPGSG